MHLTHLSLTGADDSVDPIELAKLSAVFPLIEWAILITHPDEPAPRFPGREWRREFYRTAPHARRAAHLCGNAILKEFAFASAGSALHRELGEYQRIQLNFNAKQLPHETLDAIVSLHRNGGLKNRDGEPICFITQYNDDNRGVHLLFENRPNHAVLFDASGGTGLAPRQWPLMLPGLDCGYAGGLGPENIAAEMGRIGEAVRNSSGRRSDAVWIDMETGIRSNNRFDMEKVRAVIDTVRRALATQ